MRRAFSPGSFVSNSAALATGSLDRTTAPTSVLSACISGTSSAAVRSVSCAQGSSPAPSDASDFSRAMALGLIWPDRAASALATPPGTARPTESRSRENSSTTARSVSLSTIRNAANSRVIRICMSSGRRDKEIFCPSASISCTIIAALRLRVRVAGSCRSAVPKDIQSLLLQPSVGDSCKRVKER